MEDCVSGVKSADSDSRSELLILYTTDAKEWATYLQQIMTPAVESHEKSILLYALDDNDQLHGYDLEYLHDCTCTVLLVTATLLDMLYEPELEAALQRLLYPPHRVVALLCGVPEDDGLTHSFQDWSRWRKLSSEDDPNVYISTILECIAESRQAEVEDESEAAELHNPVASLTENPTVDRKEEPVSEEQRETFQEDEELVHTGNSTSEGTSAPTPLTCLTVQPSSVLCGASETLFIIFTHKVDDWSQPEVEFSPGKRAPKRVPGSVVNEYTISVTAPDMPAGVVSLTVFADQSSVTLKPVTYHTHLGEVSRHLESASDPVDFICQAFNLRCNARDSLDKMLTESLKSRLPATTLQLFGIRQIEENNMDAYQRDEELPTLLHFAAKYGLKKLTTALLQCPGALQAYSVMNKHGDYPNTLAEKSGFTDLRQFMDEFVETADLLKSHLEESIDPDDCAEVYEIMSQSSQDIMMKYSGCSEDIYESMLGIDPDCAEDLYEAMNVVEDNPEEALLRKFFQAKPHAGVNQGDKGHYKDEEDGNDYHTDCNEVEHEEDPYNICPEDIYDTVDENTTYNTEIMNRPPAPIPRPEREPETERQTYISKVFLDKGAPDRGSMERRGLAARPAEPPPSPVYDPYAGMKTPGQRQLISLQERVKVGEITVDEAVQEFKSWQFDHERRSNSIRYQQENLKRLRDSITRRHKEKQKTGKDQDYEISAPMQRNLYWASNVTLECSVYEPTPRVMAPPPSRPAQNIQRGSWKTGSTSSTSSTESNRLSTHSTFSYSSGTEPDIETSTEKITEKQELDSDTVDNFIPPPRPPRPNDHGPVVPPPRIPPRIPESRVPDKMLNERYISCPTRALPERPSQRHQSLGPPVPRRLR